MASSADYYRMRAPHCRTMADASAIPPRVVSMRNSPKSAPSKRVKLKPHTPSNPGRLGRKAWPRERNVTRDNFNAGNNRLVRRLSQRKSARRVRAGAALLP